MKIFNLIAILLFIQPVVFAGNHFTTLFDKQNRLNIKALQQASAEAAKKADERTKHLRPKIPTINDLIGDSLLNEFNKNYRRFKELNYGRKIKRQTVESE